MLEAGVGRAHNIALSTLPNFVLPGDVSASGRYWARDIIVPPVETTPRHHPRFPRARLRLRARPRVHTVDHHPGGVRGLNGPRVLYTLIFLMIVFWSGNYIVGKIALREFSPLLLASLRIGFAGLIILPFYAWENRHHAAKLDPPGRSPAPSLWACSA
jgi:hypothetical protein